MVVLIELNEIFDFIGSDFQSAISNGKLKTVKLKKHPKKMYEWLYAKAVFTSFRRRLSAKDAFMFIRYIFGYIFVINVTFDHVYLD